MSNLPIFDLPAQGATPADLANLLAKLTAQRREVEASGVALAERLCDSPSVEVRAAARTWLSIAKGER